MREDHSKRELDIPAKEYKPGKSAYSYTRFRVPGCWRWHLTAVRGGMRDTSMRFIRGRNGADLFVAGRMALTVASTILPPDNLTIRWSPILYLGMVTASYLVP